MRVLLSLVAVVALSVSACEGGGGTDDSPVETKDVSSLTQCFKQCYAALSIKKVQCTFLARDRLALCISTAYFEETTCEVACASNDND